MSHTNRKYRRFLTYALTLPLLTGAAIWVSRTEAQQVFGRGDRPSGDATLSAPGSLDRRFGMRPFDHTKTVSPSSPSATGLDPTFGNGGKVIVPPEYYGEYAYATAIQPDGKIVAAGTVCLDEDDQSCIESAIELVRINTDGSLDPSFGIGGKVRTSIGTLAAAVSVAIQSDGKILIGENDWRYAVFALVRYNTDGSLDPSFGGGGIVITPFRTSSVAIQTDGKIVAAGACCGGFALGRYNTDGSPDTSFGVSGTVITPIGTYSAYIYSVTIQSNGKIVGAGASYDGPLSGNFGLARYNTDGSLDTSFGNGGKVITQIETEAYACSVAIQTDGKVVAAGSSQSNNHVDFALVRYNTDGSLDSSFGSGGKVVTPIGGAYSVAIQTDGKIVAAGDNYDGSNGDFVAVRYNPSGSLDTTFGGGDGISIVDFNHTPDLAFGMALDGQGRAVVVGRSGYGAFALARFLVDTSRAQFDFDGDGRSDVSVFRPAEGTWYVQQSTNGFAAANWGLATDKIVPADYDGDGKTDVAVYRPSVGDWYVLRSSTGTVLEQNFGISEDLPQPGDFDSDGRADIAVYRPSTSTWWIYQSSTGGVINAHFGTGEDKPVIGDYDGDGRADLGVFRPSNGTWYWSSDPVDPSHFTAVQFGLSDDLVTPADFDGDGRTDVAVYRPSTGVWYSLDSSNGALRATQFGLAEDIPTAADFDGDGRADISVFRPSNGLWYRLNSINGSFFAGQFGLTGDRPTPAAFRN